MRALLNRFRRLQQRQLNLCSVDDPVKEGGDAAAAPALSRAHVCMRNWVGKSRSGDDPNTVNRCVKWNSLVDTLPYHTVMLRLPPAPPPPPPPHSHLQPDDDVKENPTGPIKFNGLRRFIALYVSKFLFQPLIICYNSLLLRACPYL